MNLHEYQAKQLLAEYGLPVSKGEVAANVEEALNIANKMATPRWVVKAQVHAGGRGKAGGVKLVSTKEEVSASGTIFIRYTFSDLSNHSRRSTC